GGACTAYPFAPDSGGATWLGICAAACASDEDCPSGRVCTYNGNPLTNAFDAICERPAGPGELGADCDEAAECVSGLCLADRCSRVCEDASDCTGGVSGNGMTACEDVEVFDPAGTGSAFLRLCR